MSVQEHLEYYARLKGINQNDRDLSVNNIVDLLELEEHRHKPAGTLSGGNKRKLCVAIAILGGP